MIIPLMRPSLCLCAFVSLCLIPCVSYFLGYSQDFIRRRQSPKDLLPSVVAQGPHSGSVRRLPQDVRIGICDNQAAHRFADIQRFKNPDAALKTGVSATITTGAALYFN